MMTVYDVEASSRNIKENLNRIGNQIYKALCLREEEKEWQKPLETLSVELLGMHTLFPDELNLFSLVCKLQGILADEQMDFMQYRRTIFECCSLVNKIKDNID